MPITAEQLAALKAKVQQLSDDKDIADIKTQASNAADTISAQAAASAAQAKLEEAAADATASGDLTDLIHYIDSLGDPVPTGPPTPIPV